MRIVPLIEALFICTAVIPVRGYGSSWLDLPPAEPPSFPRPVDVMTDVINDLGIRILQEYGKTGGTGNVAFSPTGIGFVLAALYEGSAGPGNAQIAHVLDLPRDKDVARIGLRDIHRRLRSYLSPDGFLGGLTLNRENTKLRTDYEDVLKFLGFDISTAEDATNATEFNSEDSTTFSSTPQTILATTTSPTTTESSESTTTVLTTLGIEEITTIVTTVTNRITETEATKTPIPEIVAEISTSSPKESTTIDTDFDDADPVSEATMNPTSTQKFSETPTTTQVSEIPTSEGPSTMPDEIPEYSTTPAEISSIMTETVSGNDQTTLETPFSTEDATVTEPATEKITISVDGIEEAVVTTTTVIPEESATTSASEDKSGSEEEASASSPKPEVETTTTTMVLEENANSMESEKPSSSETVDESTDGSQTTVSQIAEVEDATANPENTESETPITRENETTTSVDIATTPALVDAASSELRRVRSTEIRDPVVRTLLDARRSDFVNGSKENGSVRVDKAVEYSPEEENDRQISILEEADANGKTKTRGTRSSRSYFSSFSNLPGLPIFPIYTDFHGGNPAGETYRNRKPGGWRDHSPKVDDGSPDSNEITFLVNGEVATIVSAASYTVVLPFAFLPSLQALALEFPLDDPRYNILLLLPTDRDGTRRLARELGTVSLRELRKELQPSWVRAMIPSFMLKGFVTLTSFLQRLGIRDVFEPRDADLSPMTDDQGVYARDVQQSIGVNIRNYMRPDRTHSSEWNYYQANLSPPRYLRYQQKPRLTSAFKNERSYDAWLYNWPNSYHYLNPGNGLFERAGPVSFVAEHPFLFFIIDAETGVSLIAGRIEDPLNSRIL